VGVLDGGFNEERTQVVRGERGNEEAKSSGNVSTCDGGF